MYRNKKDVDKHVESLVSKLSLKEFTTRAYSVARLYFDVGDYTSCQKYVEQYLTYKDNNAAAHKLLGQTFIKLGQKEKALEEYKTSLDIDPSQTSIILDICELLTDDEIMIDPGRARYWCEKAEAIFPRHPVTFKLREKLLSTANPDPEALVKLLNAELEVRPKDAILHARLLKHYLNTNKIKEAFEHSCNVEYESKIFLQNYDWYEIVSQVLKHSTHNLKDWLYQLLLLTVKERICLLSLTEIPSGSSKSLMESNELLFAYDEAIEIVARTGAPSGHAEFHSSLLQHHRGQLAFHAATYLLKKAKKDQISWREAVRVADIFMLIAWQTVPLDTKVNWLVHASEKQKNAVHRWYVEGSYRCSQSGHYLLSNCQDKSQLFLDQVSQYCSGAEWRGKLFEKIYTNSEHQKKIKASHITNSLNVPTLRLPRRSEVEAYDGDAQREYPNSLHHIVWILLNYKNYADFKCTLFDMLTLTATNCGPESLNRMDINAFVYCAALTAEKQKRNKLFYVAADKPYILPANITNLLCTLTQVKWWDCAYKFCQNELGTELTDIRVTLSAGIEVVRCIDNHGLDPEILCILGRIFSEQAKLTGMEDESNQLEKRAFLYYSAAIPLLVQLKNKTVIKIPEKRIFDYSHTELTSKELNSLIEESKLFVALIHLRDCEFEKVVQLLSNIKSPKAYYYLSETYKRIALEEMPTSRDMALDGKCLSLLSKSKHFAYKALDKLKEMEAFKHSSLYSETQDLIEEIEAYINKIDSDFSCPVNNMDGKHSSDENISLLASDQLPMRSNFHFRNISSTPKQSQSQANITNYRTALDSQLIESHRLDHQFLERIEKQIKNLQKRDTMVSEFMEQTKDWFKENSKLGNQIINTIHSNSENTTEQFKLLKISFDQVKSQIDECRNESKDVVDLKKEVAELKKEVTKLKKVSSDQSIDEHDVYNLNENFRSNDNTSSFTQHMPFTPPHVIPPFTQRLVPPFPVPQPYHLYGQNLYSLYNQYSQFAQHQSVAGAPPIFDPTRTQMNYPNVFPTQDQMYLDVAHLIPPNISGTTSVQGAPTIPIVPTIPVVSSTSVTSTPKVTTANVLKPTHTKEGKETSQSLPNNVVITSSDPLPKCTTAPAPILSVTIPPQHIKGSPHNYQIPMPCTSENKAITPPKFSFTQAGSKQSTPSVSIWNPTTYIDSQSDNLKNNLVNDDNVKKSTSLVESSPNASINKSRTLSEKSNTSIENYDPCPDFKPIIPLPAEVKVTTGEEDEVVIFNARAKLYRFVDKQWKERGLGEMKLLKHKTTGKVRVLMRREQIHKVCANHIILPEMEIKPVKNESKAYFWVANDFSEENVILEMFSIRFKTADIAKQFFDTFEKARQEASAIVNVTTKQPTDTHPQQKSIQDVVSDDQNNKTNIGGFTFTTAPSFKAVADNSKTDMCIKSDTSKSKINVFSGLSFKSSTETPFNNLFSTTSKSVEPIIKSDDNVENTNKLNTSDVVDEFEPAVDFKPVIPLPALIDQKTGEEDEVILFQHRAKLLRFDASAKEWKERGLGNIKLLVHKDNNQKIRLLMRREQIMKVCCNHAITKEMIFQKMPKMDNAVTWCAKDFSDGELVSETFCLRFKTVQVCNEFVDAIKQAMSRLKDDSKAAKEEQNAAKQNNQTSFQNSKSQSELTANWGDKFKSKPGQWECKKCYIRNEPNAEKCCACENPRDSTSISAPKNDNATFNFVMPSKPADGVTGWGDKFKPKEGTWECNQCLVRNEGNIAHCSACNTPKEPTSTPQTTESSSNFINTSGPKFNFGISHNNANTEQKIINDTNLSLNSSGPQKFNFGIPVTKSTNVIAFGDQKSISSYFSLSKPTDDKEQPINFSLANKNVGDSKLPTVQKTFGFAMSNPNSTQSFGFTFKSPLNEKLPINKEQTDERDNNDLGSAYEAKLPYSPLISLQNTIVSVISGEDNENLIFGEHAILYKFDSSKWGEHAVGIVKVLENKGNGKFRILMRQQPNNMICLNYSLSPEIKFEKKEETAWHFTVNDLDKGKSCLEHYCLKFQNTDIALKFKNSIDQATLIRSEQSVDKTQDDTDDVVFVGEILASNEDKKRAIELKLPENFFTYRNKPPCLGCRGCNDEETVNDFANNPEQKVKSKSLLATPESSVSTPIKMTTQSTQSPSNSVYGTPGNFDKTSDVSIFRTPLGSLGSNLKSPTIASNNMEIGVSNKENKDFIVKSDASSNEKHGDFPEQKFMFGTSNSQSNIFLSQPSTVFKKSILAAPKLDTISTAIASTESKTVFGENKSIFASSSTNAAFDFSNKNKNDVFQSAEVKSIFGNDQKPVNFFSSTSQGSIFGPSVLKQNSSKPGFNYFNQDQNVEGNNTAFGTVSNESISSDMKSTQADSHDASKNAAQTASKSDKENDKFGSSLLNEGPKKLGGFNYFSQNQNVGSNNTIFGKISNESVSSNTNSTLGVTTAISVAKSDKENIVTTTDDKGDRIEAPLKIDNSLTFAALSTSVSGFNIQTNENFKWEGAGQQLFTSKSGKTMNEKSKDISAGEEGAVGADEEYDPHYEPIVPLPDKITVTTGEEDEEKLFGERCKLYRYDEKSREWKERGVGEIKILYHPQRITYRLLLRRELVHKAVLNMLLFMDLELLPLKNSDCAWTWAGINYAENVSGEQETLAVRFKSSNLAINFHDKVVECVRKLQAAAAEAIRKQNENTDTKFESVAPLRLPKHLKDGARADEALSAKSVECTDDSVAVTDTTKQEPSAESNATDKELTSTETKQVHFEEDDTREDDDHEQYYDHNDDSYDNYNDEEEEEDESGVYFSCEGEAIVQTGSKKETCSHAHIQVVFDQDLYSPKIFVTDNNTGEVLADMLIHTDTEFQISGDSCSWSGMDYDSVNKTVTINFPDSDTAMYFYDSCETSKAATYSSTDPES